MSHGLQSEPQTSYTAVLPNPARNLSILAVEDSKISLQWLPPVNSLLTEYNIRYKPVVRRWGGADHVQDAKEGDLSRPWSEVMVVPRNSTSFILADLPPGEDGRLSVTTFPRIVQTMPRPPARRALHALHNGPPSNQESFVSFGGKSPAGRALRRMHPVKCLRTTVAAHRKCLPYPPLVWGMRRVLR